MSEDPRRQLPSVTRLLELTSLPANRLWVSLIEAELAQARATLTQTGEPIAESELARRVQQAVARSAPGLTEILNGTGVVIHTNIGRAPLSERAAAMAARAALGYSDLEFDLLSGHRSSRQDHLQSLLTLLTGAEAAVVVNNNAAAVFLALITLTQGRQVVISRGELVEIGGSFRVPDIMAASGTELVEVGTTNRTRLADYERAIGPNTAALLRVHPSNFQIRGFTEQADPVALAQLAHAHHLVMIDDLGSGSLLPLPAEPDVASRVRQGADVVTFSGDKLLGGPQAGIAVGHRAVIDQMKRHPLYRALRPDKMTLAALRATLWQTLVEPDQIPVRQMVTADPDALRRQAKRLVGHLKRRGVPASLRPKGGVAGGGSMPDVELPGVAVAIDPRPKSASAVQAELRQGAVALLVQVEGGMIVVDVRTLPAQRLAEVAEILARCLLN
ncbi:MAG: L-seryl-tRNA(Sec) selenium transferase [Sulfobacillus sp.]